MRKHLLAILVMGYGTFFLASTDASAFSRYRANDPVHSYCLKSPRWDYAAAYYQSYRHYRRVYRRACGC